MNHSEDRKSNLIDSTDDDLWEDVMPSLNDIGHPSKLLELKPVIEKLIRSELQKEEHSSKVIVSTFQSMIEANTKIFKLQVDSQTKDMERRFQNLEDNLKLTMESHRKDIQKQIKAVSFLLRKTVIASSRKLDSNRNETFDEPFKLSLRQVPGFEETNLTFLFQSSHGNYLTALNFHDIGSVRQRAAFQEWTVVPSGDSFVYLRNEHGTYLCAYPDGNVKSQQQAKNYEKWTVEMHDDGIVSIRSYHGSYLSDSPNVGICVTTELGWHQWRCLT